VEGPGFGLRGPALLDASDRALRGAVSLAVQNLGKTRSTSKVIFETLIDKASNVGYVKKLLCGATGLNVQCCCLSGEKPGRMEDKMGNSYILPASFMRPLDDQMRLSSLGEANGHLLLHLVYTGKFEEDFCGRSGSGGHPSSGGEDSAQGDDSDEGGPAAPESAHGGQQQPRFDTPHPGIPELDDFENRLDFEGHNMEPVIVPQRLGHRALMAGGAENLVREHELRNLVREYRLPTAANPAGILDFPNEFADDELQFGPTVDPLDIPDFRDGQGIEWIDAD